MKNVANLELLEDISLLNMSYTIWLTWQSSRLKIQGASLLYVMEKLLAW